MGLLIGFRSEGLLHGFSAHRLIVKLASQNNPSSILLGDNVNTLVMAALGTIGGARTQI